MARARMDGVYRFDIRTIQQEQGVERRREGRKPYVKGAHGTTSIGDAWGVRKKRRRASSSRFLANQAIGRCKPLCLRQLARAALERQGPSRTCENTSRTVARLPSVIIGSTR